MAKLPNQQKSDKDKQKKRFFDPQSARALAKYSGMAFQMGIIIVGGVLLGKKLDQVLNSEPYLSLLCSLGSVFAALYISLKDFISPRKKDKK